MSSTVQTPKISTIRLLNNGNLMSLFILAALVVTLIVIFTFAVDRPAANSIHDQAYMTYRQGEWISAPVSSAEAYQIFRRGEVASPGNPAEAYRIFRLGEWASSSDSAADLAAYHLSERTLVDPQAGFMQYLLSERTFIDPQAGLALYRQSERTRTPPFTKYQRSEWFGK